MQTRPVRSCCAARCYVEDDSGNDLGELGDNLPFFKDIGHPAQNFPPFWGTRVYGTPANFRPGILFTRCQVMCVGDGMGQGLVAVDPIAPQQPIIAFGGYVVQDPCMDDWDVVKNYVLQGKSAGLFLFPPFFPLHGGQKDPDCMAYYANHAPEDDANALVVYSRGKQSWVLVATRDISKNEQIFWDYGVNINIMLDRERSDQHQTVSALGRYFRGSMYASRVREVRKLEADKKLRGTGNIATRGEWRKLGVCLRHVKVTRQPATITNPQKKK